MEYLTAADVRRLIDSRPVNLCMLPLLAILPRHRAGDPAARRELLRRRRAWRGRPSPSKHRESVELSCLLNAPLDVSLGPVQDDE